VDPVSQKQLVQECLTAYQASGAAQTRDVVDDTLRVDLEEHDGRVFHGGLTPRNSVRRTLTELQAEGLVVKDGRGRLVFTLDGLAGSVFEADVLDVLRLCPDDSLPVVIADPPWSYMTEHTSRGTTTRMAGAGTRWFSTPDLPAEVLAEIWRALRPGGVFLCWLPPMQEAAAKQWRVLGELMDLGFRPLREITWVKGKGPGYGWAPASEPCFAFYKPGQGRPAFHDLSTTNVLQHPRLSPAAKTPYTDFTTQDEAAWQTALERHGSPKAIPDAERAELRARSHACEKPVPMLMDLLRPLLGPGKRGRAPPDRNLVMDLYSGSGSASLAALRLGARFCAVESDTRNVENLILPRLGEAVQRVVRLAAGPPCDPATRGGEPCIDTHCP